MMNMMNKIKISLLFVLGCLMAQNMAASERQPDSCGDANYLYTSDFIRLDPVTGLGTLELWLDNVTENFNSFQLDLYLPEGFEIAKSGRTYDVKANNGNEKDSKTFDHTISVMYSENGFYRLTGYSVTLQYILASDDILLTATIKAPDNFDYNEVANAQIKNIMFAAGSVGHVFQDMEFEMEDPIPLILASGDEEMWDKEWSESELQFPLQFLDESNQIAEVGDSDVEFSIVPKFTTSNSDALENFSLSGDDKNGWVNLQFPEPGLYEVSLSIAKGKRYTIDGKKSVMVKNANIYPSLDGLVLAYESVKKGGEIVEYAPTSDNEISYQFEIVEGTKEWYHENAKNPKVSLKEEDVEIWYRLHGLEDVVDLTPDNKKKAPADPTTNGYKKATDDNNIYIGKLAYASENTPAELSFILKKNGAATPLIADSIDGKSEQIVTLRKATNVETGIEEVIVVDEEPTIYDLQGRIVKNPAPGIYIVGGKKVVVK